MGLQPACKMSSLPPSPASRNPQMFPAQRVFSLSHHDRPKTQAALGKAAAPKPSSETQTAQGHGRRGCSFGFQPAGSISNRENASTARSEGPGRCRLPGEVSATITSWRGGSRDPLPRQSS